MKKRSIRLTPDSQIILEWKNENEFSIKIKVKELSEFFSTPFNILVDKNIKDDPFYFNGEEKPEKIENSFEEKEEKKIPFVEEIPVFLKPKNGIKELELIFFRGNQKLLHRREVNKIYIEKEIVACPALQMYVNSKDKKFPEEFTNTSFFRNEKGDFFQTTFHNSKTPTVEGLNLDFFNCAKSWTTKGSDWLCGVKIKKNPEYLQYFEFLKYPDN